MAHIEAGISLLSYRCDRQQCSGETTAAAQRYVGVIGLRSRPVGSRQTEWRLLRQIECGVRGAGYDVRGASIEAPLLQLVGALLEAAASAAIATATTTAETTTTTTTTAGAGFLWFGLIDSQRTSVHL